MNGEFLLGDCFEHMAEIPDGSVDMVLCDLPYGTTRCAWDTVLPFEQLWAAYWRVCKPGATVVLTATQPFSSALVMSSPRAFRHEWIWKKSCPTGFANAKRAPLRETETVLVFCKTPSRYFPQGLVPFGKTRKNSASVGGDSVRGQSKAGSLRTPGAEYAQEFTGYPRQILEFPNARGGFHPTQKPVALFEYLINTYTLPGETVLDNCAGSGTTAIAAENTGRRWICIEKDPTYWARALARVMENDQT